jgi:hypothetical protein
MKRTVSLPMVFVTLGIIFLGSTFYRSSDPLSKAVEILQQYVNQYTPEKIYIATDRPFYAAGEIMWYKAWLVNGVNHKPDSPSQTMYAELLSPAGDVVLSNVLKSVDGGVAGDFYLPENLAPGEYTLRAYTSWMKNFDESWMFRRNIRIMRAGDNAPQADIKVESGSTTDKLTFRWVLVDESGEPLVNTDVDLALQIGRDRVERVKVKTNELGSIEWSTTISKASAASEIPSLEVAYRSGRGRVSYSLPIAQLAPMELHFMPEGGDLIAGTEQRVAFKANDGSGRSVTVTGLINDSAGNEVTSFADSYRGMGFFTLNAKPGETYTAIVSLNGAPQQSFRLPEVKDYGISLSADVTDPDYVLLSIRTVGLATDVTLIGHTRGELVFSGGASASPDGFVAKVPKQSLKSGITHFTVFDGAGKPMAERLVFMPPSPRGNVQLLANKDVYKRREAVQLDVAYLDEAGKPIRSNVAVSVIRDDEADYTFENRSDIRSYLLLSSDLKGFVEAPSYYMSQEPVVQQRADVLMMTHGWRRFKWDAFISGTTPEITHFVEDGITISGTYLQKSNNRIIRNEEITLAVDPQNPNYFTLRTDNDGRFRVEGLEISDSTTVVVQGDDNNGRRPIDFTIDPLYTPHKDTKWQPRLLAIPLESIDRAYAKNARNRQAIDRSFGLSNSVRVLGEIVVQARATTQQEQVQEQYNRVYGSPDRSFVPTAADLQRGGTAFDLLRGRTGAFRISGTGAGTRVTSARAATLTSSTVPLFFLDGVEVDASAIARMRIQDIGVIDILTEVSSTVMFGARGSNGVISVFTRKGGPSPIPETNMVSKKVPGYYIVREFYAPKYDKNADIHRKPDSRSTLWWAHTVRTDQTGLAKLQFYTSDDTGLYRIRVEGIDDDGMPLMQEMTFRVE